MPIAVCHPTPDSLPNRLTRAARRIAAGLGFALCLGAAPVAAQAAVINFDDLACGTGMLIPNGYAGLDWSTFECVDGTAVSSGNSGYNAGRVSGTNVAYNGYGYPAEFVITAPAGAKFNFNSVYLTGAWNDDLVVTIEAYRDAGLVSTTSHTLSATAPTLVTLNLANIDRVRMTSADGTPHPGYPGSGFHFVMDNLDVGPASVTAVPTLSEWSLLLLAMVLGATALHQRRRG
jgi:hypothetical protein